MIDRDMIRSMHDSFKVLEKEIKNAQTIVIYRHTSPDFDAFGTQLGLAQWIRDNYPEKEVHTVGDSHPTFVPLLFPEPEVLPEEFYEKEHLAITVDVADKRRIADSHIDKASKVIKIDHHHAPSDEQQFGDIRIVYETRPAAAEIIALFCFTRSKKYRVSKETASYLYTGIVGDTGRFQYQDTDGATLRIAADLLDCGIDKTDIYEKMYRTNERDVQILKFCIDNHHVTQGGIVYYILTQQDLDRLNMTTHEANKNLSTFRTMEEAQIVASVTEDRENGDWRVSLRSKSTDIHTVAERFNGGGHDFAAGARLKSLDELPDLISQLEELLK